MNASPYITYILIFITGFITSSLAIPRIIYIAKRKRLFDVPDNDRKLHANITPNLGGIGISLAFITVSSIFINPLLFYKWNYIVASSTLLFLTGVTDDLVSISPLKKLLGQVLAAIITVYIADIRITSLHGILGVYEMPKWISLIFTIGGCVFVTNALNLIDGVDGLAGSIGSLCALALGICLAMLGNEGGACIAFSLTAAIMGFLRYNIAPAKVFMGDTGSLIIGFTISVLAILVTRSYHYNTELSNIIHSSRSGMVVMLAIIFIPVFDSFRVFITRLSKGGSPFKADRSHIHHFLLDVGFTHTQVVSILVISNVLIVIIALLLQDVNPNITLLCMIAFAGILFTILFYMRKKKLAENQQIIAAHKKNMLQGAQHVQ